MALLLVNISHESEPLKDDTAIIFMEAMPGSVTNMHGGALALWVSDVGAGKDLYGQAIGADAHLMGDPSP